MFTINSQGLSLPNYLEPSAAAYIAAAYAAETRNILEAEAFIAERRYRQHVIATQSLKLQMLKTRRTSQEARAEVARFQAITNDIIRTSARPELVNLPTLQPLFDANDPSELRRFRGTCIF
jgi:hypothetical protein